MAFQPPSGHPGALLLFPVYICAELLSRGSGLPPPSSARIMGAAESSGVSDPHEVQRPAPS